MKMHSIANNYVVREVKAKLHEAKAKHFMRSPRYNQFQSLSFETLLLCPFLFSYYVDGPMLNLPFAIEFSSYFLSFKAFME